MRPNVEFRVDLPKTNPGLASKATPPKARGYVQKTAPDTVMTADWALKAYKYTTMDAEDTKKLAKNPLDALNKSNNRILKCLVIMCIESRLVLY